MPWLKIHKRGDERSGSPPPRKSSGTTSSHTVAVSNQRSASQFTPSLVVVKGFYLVEKFLHFSHPQGKILYVNKDLNTSSQSRFASRLCMDHHDLNASTFPCPSTAVCGLHARSKYAVISCLPRPLSVAKDHKRPDKSQVKRFYHMVWARDWE